MRTVLDGCGGLKLPNREGEAEEAEEEEEEEEEVEEHSGKFT